MPIGVIHVQVNGQLVRQGLQNLSDEIPKVGRLQIYRTTLRIRTAMKVRGTKPSYPIQWDSNRQKLAFFASNGFGGGIPHIRRDDYINYWQIEKLGDVGYRVFNQSRGALAIAGDVETGRQSRIHKGRWPVFKTTVQREIEKLPEDIAKDIVVVARRNGLAR